MKIGVIQLTSLLDAQHNLNVIENLILEGKKSGADIFFLPECFLSMSDGSAPTPHLVEKNNQWYKKIQELASKHQVALIGGSAATVNPANPEKVINRAYNFDQTGKDLGSYDKIHLFACDLPNKKISEGRIYAEGNESKVIEVNNVLVGMNICFDLRFSEMALAYRQLGCQILTYASAFTVPTGRAHWHTLLRARAIESQCFVVASAQWGHHNDKIQTFGHSLVIDPWGDILLDLQDGEKVGVVDLNLERITEVRQSVLMRRE